MFLKLLLYVFVTSKSIFRIICVPYLVRFWGFLTIWIRIKNMLFILLIVSSFLAVDGGHLVFFSPFCSKSSVLTLPGLANELIQRGQKVTVVTSWPGLNFHPNVNQVLVDSGFSELNDQFSWMILSKNHTSLELFRVYNNLVGKSLKTAQVAITSEQLHKILASKKKKHFWGLYWHGELSKKCLIV